MAKTKENLTVGRADTNPEAPSHISGVAEGNARGSYAQMEGHNADGTSSAARSTSITPDASEPILPSMPNLSPA